jgi:hypothetical protein
MKIDHWSFGLAVALAFIGLSVPDLRGSGGQSPGGTVGSVLGPSQQPPVRDRVPAPQVGRGAIRGRVVDGQTGAALVRARVRLMGQGPPRPAALTDGQGAFTFTGLPPGVYSIGAEKATYMPGSYPDRGRSLRSSSARPLSLRDNEVLENVIVSLYHGSAITGRVVDEYGDPVESAQVFALPVTGSGAVRSGPRAQMSTNDIGEFRIGRLPPGRYVLMANANQRFPVGPVVDAAPLPQPVPTYYPNGLSRSEAQPIPVGRGQTLPGIEIVMVEGLPTVVTGRVIAADGQPVTPATGGGFVSVRLDEREFQGSSMNGTGLRPDGSFQLLLAPGNYVLEARRTLPTAAGAAAGRSNEQFGRTKVSVGGESMDVSIVIGAGATVSGRVVFEGATPPPPPPARPGSPLHSLDGGMCTSGQLQIGPDWSFRLDGLHGTCGAPPFGMFGRWTLKSVLFNNQELKSGAVTFETGQHYGNVQIVVTDRPTELNLRVTDEQGQLTRDYVALVFSADKTRWVGSSPLVRTFVPPSPEIQAAMQRASVNIAAAGGNPSGQPGREVIMGLTAGEYYAIALDDIDSEGSRDPDVLERLASSASRLTIAEGASDVTLLRLRLSDVIR